MTTTSLKSKGLYAEAGASAYANDEGRSYGCHFGMRSDREASMAAFYRGYDDAEASANLAALEDLTVNEGSVQRRGYLSIDYHDGAFTYRKADVAIDRAHAFRTLRAYLAGSATTHGESAAVDSRSY